MRRVAVTGLGDRLLDRQQRQRGHRVTAGGPLGHRRRARIRRARLPLPGARHARDRLGGAWSTAARRGSWRRARPTPTSPWSRRSPTPASSEAEVSDERTGLIVGSGGPSTRTIVEAADIAREKGPKRIGPFAVPKAMSSGPSATLATWFKIKGHQLFDLLGLRDLDPLHRRRRPSRSSSASRTSSSPAAARSWTGRCRCCSTPWAPCRAGFNDRPAVASRAYDADRDGFVIAGGAGIVVLEELERAKARGAKIYAEITGYAANSDGYDMVAPVGRGRGALHAHGAWSTAGGRKIDYLNPHGTSTPVGDAKEMEAVREVFGDDAAADLVDQVADRPQPGRRRRAGGDLLPPDDAERLRRRERPHRHTSTPPSTTCRSCAERKDDRAGDGDVQQLRLRRHQRLHDFEPCLRPRPGDRFSPGFRRERCYWPGRF